MHKEYLKYNDKCNDKPHLCYIIIQNISEIIKYITSNKHLPIKKYYEIPVFSSKLSVIFQYYTGKVLKF